MCETLDQIFVLLKHWLVGFLPAGWQASRRRIAMRGDDHCRIIRRCSPSPY